MRLVHVAAVLLLCTVARAGWRSQDTFDTYIGGEFSGLTAAGEPLIGVAVLEQGQWHPVGTLLKRYGEWSSLVSNGTVAVVAGNFGWLDGAEVNNIACFRLDEPGGRWEPLGLGVHGRIAAVAAHEALVYVVGQISYCYGEPRIYVSNVAAFDFAANAWSTVGGGIEYGGVLALQSVAVNERGQVFVAGWGVEEEFGVEVKAPVLLAYTPATDWVSLLYHSNGVFNDGTDNEFNVVATHGPDLYVGGSFTIFSANGTVLATNLAKWSAGGWHAVGSQTLDGTIDAIVVDSNGNLMVSGWFLENLNIVYDNKLYLAGHNRWLKFQSDESLAHPIVLEDTFVFCGYLEEAGVVSVGIYNTSVPDVASAFSVVDFPYASLGLDAMLMDTQGLLRTVSHLSPYSFLMARYDRQQQAWSEETAEKLFVAKGAVRDMLFDASGHVVVAGWFSLTANDTEVNNIAQWDGEAWSSFGPSLGIPLQWSPQAGTTQGIMAMARAGQGADEAIYVAGRFDYTTQDGQRLLNAAYLNVTADRWMSMQGGIQEFVGVRADVVATDALVLVGGQFTKQLGNSTVHNLIAWNLTSASWASFGYAQEGIGGSEDAVYALLVVEQMLYIGGSFKMEVEHRLFTNVVAWDMAAQWWVYDIQATFTSTSSINCLAYANGALYAGGDFVTISGKMANNVAVWTAASGWSNLGNGLQNLDVESLAYNGLEDVVVADGLLEYAATTHRLQAWQVQSSSPYQWAAVGGEIEDWDGAVGVISVQPRQYLEPWTGLQLLLLLLLVAVVCGLLLVPLLVGAAYVYKQRRRSLYRVLPQFLKDRQKVTLEGILNDSSVPQIQFAELELHERIGGGACGEVLRATWKTKEVAVKRIYLPRHSVTSNSSFLVDFLVEVKLLSVLDHPNVLRFLGISTSGSDLLLVLELMEYGSLADILYGAEEVDGLMRLDFMIDAAKGMRYLHQLRPPIIHRDLKPENLLIDRRLRCKVSDFGISTVKMQNQTMTFVGTPVYMAPEIISKSRQYSTEVDVYSFGVLLLEVWTKRKPYSGARCEDYFPGQIMYLVVHEGLRPLIPPDVPPALARIVEECLEEDPSLRPTFTELIKRLKRLRIAVRNEAAARPRLISLARAGNVEEEGIAMLPHAEEKGGQGEEEQGREQEEVEEDGEDVGALLLSSRRRLASFSSPSAPSLYAPRRINSWDEASGSDAEFHVHGIN